MPEKPTKTDTTLPGVSPVIRRRKTPVPPAPAVRKISSRVLDIVDGFIKRTASGGVVRHRDLLAFKRELTKE